MWYDSTPTVWTQQDGDLTLTHYINCPERAPKDAEKVSEAGGFVTVAQRVKTPAVISKDGIETAPAVLEYVSKVEFETLVAEKVALLEEESIALEK